MLALIPEHSLGRQSPTRPQAGPWAERGPVAQVGEGPQAVQWPGVATARGPPSPMGSGPLCVPRLAGALGLETPAGGQTALGPCCWPRNPPRVLNLWEPRPGSQALCWSLFCRTKETSRAGSEPRRARSPSLLCSLWPPGCAPGSHGRWGPTCLCSRRLWVPGGAAQGSSGSGGSPVALLSVHPILRAGSPGVAGAGDLCPKAPVGSSIREAPRPRPFSRTPHPPAPGAPSASSGELKSVITSPRQASALLTARLLRSPAPLLA